MIDTIILVIPKDGYTVFDHDKFHPSTRRLFDKSHPDFGSRAFLTYKQNPTKEDYRAGIYKPKLTITERLAEYGIEEPLKIEFSIPKLLYGNNVDELEDRNFDSVIEVLKQRLNEMGVRFFENPIFNPLINASVSGIHFSKNILLNDYTTASMVIRELDKIDLNEKLDLNRTHFRNGGRALYLYANSFSIVFYDKWADITKGRATDKDKTLHQLDLFKKRQELLQPNEILRFEVQLIKKQKLKSVLKEVGFEEELTFKNIFNSSLSQKVINFYWQKIISDSAYVLKLFEGTPERILTRILTNPNKRPDLKDAFTELGISLYIHHHGAKNLRDMVERRYSEKSWFRLKKYIKNDILDNQHPTPFFIEEVSRELEKFTPLRTVDLGINLFDNVNKSKV